MSNIPAILHLFVMGGGAVLAGVWVMDGDRCWTTTPIMNPQLSYPTGSLKQLESKWKIG